MGMAYANGQGVMQNLEKAAKWFHYASTTDMEGSGLQVNEMIKKGALANSTKVSFTHGGAKDGVVLVLKGSKATSVETRKAKPTRDGRARARNAGRGDPGCFFFVAASDS